MKNQLNRVTYVVNISAFTRKIKINNQDYTLHIVDTAGQVRKTLLFKFRDTFLTGLRVVFN